MLCKSLEKHCLFLQANSVMNIANIEELVKTESIGKHEKYIGVPRGWNRCLENGNIVYFRLVIATKR